MPIAKTNWRRSIAVLLCALLLFCTAFSFTAYADTAVVTTGSMYSYFQTYGSNGVWKDIQTPSHWITSTGEVAYCLQTSMDPPYNSSYSTVDGSYYYNDYVLTGLLAIVQNGYPTTNAGFTDEQARYATANAIRFFLAENYADGVPQYLNLNVNGDWIRGKSGYEDLYEWALYLVELAEWGAASTGSSGSLTFSPSSLALTEDSAGQYFTGQITVNKSISDPYGLAYSLPNGTVINGYTGDRSETLTIKVPTSYENGSYTLCAYGTHTGAQAKLFFWAPSQTNQQRVMTYVLDTTDDYLEAYATITTPSASPKSGSIQITKTDDSGNPLSGVSFELYDDYTTLKGSGQTNSSGVLTFSNLPLGTYYYKETATLPGFILDLSYHVVSITENGQVARVTVRNSRGRGSIIVTKTDSETDEPLAGVHFKLFDAGGQLVAEGDTGDDGRLYFEDIPVGTYTLQETATLSGYVLDDTPQEVSIPANGRMVFLTVENDPATATLVINKTDAETGAALSGVTFDLYNGSGIRVGEGTTNAQGKITFNGLQLGSYSVVETETKPGYVLGSTPITATLTSVGQTVIKNVTNRIACASIVVNKTDSESGAALSGVHFVLKDSAGTKVDEGDTGTDGTLTFSGLPLGSYTLQETATKTGYVLDSTPISVELTADGQTVTKSITNTLARGSLKIIKKDADGDTRLAGAGYRLMDSGGEQLAEGYTDANGELVFENLRQGSYQVQEFSAPRGYRVDGTVYPVTVGAGVTTETRTDLRRPGTLNVRKQDEKGQPLAGASFLLEYSTDSGASWAAVFSREGDGVQAGGCTGSGLEDGQLTTDSTGSVTFSGLRADGAILYRLTETRAPSGYTLPGAPLYTGTLPVETVHSNIEDSETVDGVTYGYTLYVTATDSPTFRLPETGGDGFGLLPVFLSMLAVPTIILKRKTNY